MQSFSLGKRSSSRSSASTTKENDSGVVATNRVPVDFRPPQLTSPRFRDKGGLKPNPTPTPSASVKTRPYSLHTLGERQPRLTHIAAHPLPEQGGCYPLIFPHHRNPARLLRHSLETLYLIYLISRWQKVTAAQSGLENTASAPPSPLQDHAGAVHPSFLVFLSTLSGFCLCFTAVRDGIKSAATSLPRPKFSQGDFLSFHDCKCIFHPVHPVGGKNFFIEGEKRKSFHLSPFPPARRRSANSKLSIVKARSEG